MKNVKPRDQHEDGQTPEYPLSAPIKPDDPERKSDQSQADTRDWSESDDKKP
jgi:hypothetical protein